jgi:hypothetical protein
MQFSYFIKNKGKIILIICLILAIALTLGIIIYLNHNQDSVSSKNTATSFDLKNYAQLKTDVNKAFTDSTVNQNPSAEKFYSKLTSAEDPSLSAQDKYNALALGYAYLRQAYSETNDHVLYTLPEEYANFVKTNFSKDYREADFRKIPCQDKLCEDEPQPAEILKVVDEINASSIPDPVKTTFVRNLLNAGYISKNDPEYRAFNYYVVANILKGSGALTDAGLNTKLSQEVIDYVQKAYPNQYQTIIKNEK